MNAKTDLKLVEEDIVNKKKYDYQSKTKQEEGNGGCMGLSAEYSVNVKLF